MPIKRKFKIKNWKLAVLAFIFICLFSGLGTWQLSRAQQKRLLIASFTHRTQHMPFSAQDLKVLKDWRFYRVTLVGSFDNEHTFLLDNKTFRGKIGYEVYTPFYSNGFDKPILVDRGFIPGTGDRKELPAIREIKGLTHLTGMLNLPPLYVALGQINDNAISWPLRIEFINLAAMGSLLNAQFFPYILIMNPKDARAYHTEWVVSLIPPERHLAYAVQWFALALTLLILFVALNRSK